MLATDLSSVTIETVLSNVQIGAERVLYGPKNLPFKYIWSDTCTVDLGCAFIGVLNLFIAPEKAC